MINKIADALFSRLSDMADIKQTEFYEGQFEKLDNYVINPPAVLIEFMAGEPGEADDPFGIVDVKLHLITSSLYRTPTSMLGILGDIVLEFNNQPLLDEEEEDQANYVGRMFIGGWRNSEMVIPGLVVYELDVQVRR
jgi:hypothetical protein